MIPVPLIILIALVVTGIAYVYDFFKLRPSRKARIAQVESDFDKVDLNDRAHRKRYMESRAQADTESAFIDVARSVFPIILVVFVLRSFFYEPFQIPSGSMIPTLEVGDFILVNKNSYGIRLPVIRKKVISTGSPKRGDVMVFFPPNQDSYFIKRVMGLPGDKITYIGTQRHFSRLFINGEELGQEMVSKTDVRCTVAGHRFMVARETLPDGESHLIRLCEYQPEGFPLEEYTVPENHYFMMGDNRDDSSDSRVWGTVPEDRIVGKAVVRWMFWTDKFKSLPSFSRVGRID